MKSSIKGFYHKIIGKNKKILHCALTDPEQKLRNADIFSIVL